MSARRRERARTAGDGRVASERKRRTGAARAAHHRVSSHDPHRLVHEHARGDERGDGDGAHDLPRRVGVHLGAVPGDRPGVRATAIWRPKLRRRRVVGREPAPVSRAQKARAEIRQHQKQVPQRFEKQREAHQEFLAQDFINMIAMEDRRREDVEKEIVDMEADERKHIENLRKLQEEQKMAYDALEQALASR